MHAGLGDQRFRPSMSLAVSMNGLRRIGTGDDRRLVASRAAGVDEPNRFSSGDT
jgi:hypothetical protein